MVVLSASICTRGGKAVLARQFREMPRSRVEALLASFPKLADSGTQHTTVEQDNVRFVYQPLDELYIVLITNRQSNILQDIDSLHLFAQVVSSICKTLDEREILRNAYELLSAFDEVVTMGLRENLTITQIKTFLEMDSHEERIQEIIQRNKELEAAEEKKRKMKQMELQKKEAMRNARNNIPSTPSYPKYVPPATPVMTQTYDSYAAEKNKSKPTITRGKGMQLGKKSKPSDIFEQLKSDLGPEIEETTPLVQATQQLTIDEPEPFVDSSENPVQLTIAENISARISREGVLQAFSIKGDLQLRILDPSMSKVKLDLHTEALHGAQFRTHPNVDKPAFTNSKTIQLRDTSRGFPPNNSVGVLRWNATIPSSETSLLPLSFTVWVNKGSGSSHTITVEYEFSGDTALSDVSLSIPFSSGEPTVSSFDANYEMTESSVEWKVGDVGELNASGSFEIEAQADDESEFFPMRVNFVKSQPIIPVDVTSVSLIELDQEIPFEKVVQSVADSYVIE